MKKQHTALSPGAVFAVTALVVLVLNAPKAAASAEAALELCFKTVIPTLFPFLVVTRIFLSSEASAWVSRWIGRWLCPLFGLPPDGASVLAVGWIGGYPIGAKSAAEGYAAGRFTKDEAERLMSFSCNASPGLFFGMLSALFGSPRAGTVLYAVHLTSAMLTGLLLRPRHPGTASRRYDSTVQKKYSDPTADAVKAMAMICGHIVVFRVLASFLADLPMAVSFPAIRAAVTGLLEVTGGLCALPALASPRLQYCMASGFTAFGGLCVLMQTRSVLSRTDLRLSAFLYGKTIQSAMAAGLTWILLAAFPGLPASAVPASTLPNHAGLLQSTGIVTGICLVLFGIWCVYLRNRAGNTSGSIV